MFFSEIDSRRLRLFLEVAYVRFNKEQLPYYSHHYNDVIMSAAVSQITGVSMVCWTVYWAPDRRLECGTWYHHPRRLQCVWSWNLRISKVATWHNRCRHNLKNNCIWDNLQCCLLVPRSPSKPVMLTIDLQSGEVLFIEIVFWHVLPGKTIMILAFIDETLPLQFAPGVNLS